MSGLVQRTDSDCLRVGLAWALDLNYELVPDFVSESTWDKDLQDWLERRGLALKNLSYRHVLAVGVSKEQTSKET